jgi:hypothetical protein
MSAAKKEKSSRLPHGRRELVFFTALQDPARACRARRPKESGDAPQEIRRGARAAAHLLAKPRFARFRRVYFSLFRANYL